MINLSDCINRLAPSATLAMSQKSSEMKAQGIDVINLSVGEPDFNTPDHIKEAAKKAIDDNYSRYSPVAGYASLREAIVRKLKRENGLDYTSAQISVSNGAKQGVCNTVMALVNKGDEVIIPAPYWVSYPQMVKMADGEPDLNRSSKGRPGNASRPSLPRPACSYSARQAILQEASIRVKNCGNWQK